MKKLVALVLALLTACACVAPALADSYYLETGDEMVVGNCRTAPLYYTEEDIRGYVRLLVDTVCSSLPTIRIGRQELPTQTVREVFLRLNAGHILYVMERLQGVQGVRDPLAYKRTALYNAAMTYGEYAMGIQQTA